MCLSPALTATGFFGSQPNPSELPDPDMSHAAAPAEVASHVLALDRAPKPELTLRRKWHWLGVLSAIAPRVADRLLVKRVACAVNKRKLGLMFFCVEVVSMWRFSFSRGDMFHYRIIAASLQNQY